MQTNETEKKLNNIDSSILKELFNFIIPPSSNKILPGAGFLCDCDNLFSVQDISTLRIITKQIYDYCKSDYNKKISEINTFARLSILQKFKQRSTRYFNDLAFIIIKYYYTNDHILEIIGVKPRPPFPDGNTIIEGDLLLFEQVCLRGKCYR